MLIVGAKGFAKEVLEVLQQLKQTENLVFFDDISLDVPNLLFNRFPILQNEKQVKEHFKKYGNSFVLGIGNPNLRKLLCEKFENWGGTLKSVISPSAEVGSYDVQIGEGAIILPGAVLANSCHIGKGCILYYNTMITHDCYLGDFVELSPGATILGGAKIGELSQIGANSTILPKVSIGASVTVGAGAVVTKNFLTKCTLIGIPAKKTL